MGFDIYGINAKSKKGEYFRRNVWGWKPLWEAVTRLEDNILTDEEKNFGWYNDGEMINTEKATWIGKALSETVDDGSAVEYIEARNQHLTNLNDEKCEYCNGTGTRNDKHVQGTCNACHGKGSVRPFETWYSLELDDIKEFAEFCLESGGFQIC